ncbi:MAG: VOC family protein [Chryseotalea sp. WA131a]|jgi:hypothetical protein|nr:MAG: VOC family protein [Chryseotalea sp. WA131a]
MDIDHIFIFTDDNGKIADKLVEFGLVEGSNRVHVGQGTTNRKFYFDNFFLEILWVHNEQEIKSDLVKPIGLWQRADYKRNQFSPYGLCIVKSDDNNGLFENSFEYQPDYFPNGMTIEILRNENQPQLPWTFRLPFKGQKKNEKEPKNHKNGIKRLTKVNFNYKNSQTDKYLNFFSEESNIDFTVSEDYGMTLTFDNNKQGHREYFAGLKLTIEY